MFHVKQSDQISVLESADREGRDGVSEMDIEFEPHFKKYEALIRAVEDAFACVKSEYGEQVKCRIGCADCCHALFDITLIEAVYIHHHFTKLMDEAKTAELIEKANSADRKIYRIKRNAFKASKGGVEDDKILEDIAKERVRCPLLNSQDQCDLYDYRPITCRLYGIPTAIKGKGHTCGISGFQAGTSYPTINMDVLHQKLYEMSVMLIHGIRSKHIKMADMLVPVSMALLAAFDEEYLAIGKEEE